jgi:HPt (histidine-containing phosphotransfer) domain-containing protein
LQISRSREWILHEYSPVNASHNDNNGQPAVFDPTRLEILIDMEDDTDALMIKDITGQFIEDITAVMARLGAAIAAGNFAQAAAASHTIKGSCATFGLRQAEKLARNLEASAKNAEKQDALLAIHTELLEAWEKGKAALEAYFAEK